LVYAILASIATPPWRITGEIMRAKGMARRRLQFEVDAAVHQPYLDRLASSLTHHREDAQDLVQETLLRAFRFYDRFEQGTNIRAWLTRILKNNFINTCRQAARERRVFDPVAVAPNDAPGPSVEPRATLPGPEERVIQSRLADRLAEMLDRLPEPYRGTLLLHLEDLTYREIADRLDVPVGTVMSRLHRARGLLRAEMVRVPDAPLKRPSAATTRRLTAIKQPG
jgi:RNA polymerase sigma-70 factor (ECF subfamily)